MNLNKLWVPDPASKNKPSVSLTLLVISVIFVLAAGTMQVLDMVKTTGPFLEMMYSFIALYFGRKMTVAGHEYLSTKADKIKEKIEKEVENE